MSEGGALNARLIAFRQSRGWNQSDVASMLSLALDQYQLIESGIEKINDEVAIKLSKLYKVPLGLLISTNYSEQFSIMFSHCNFQDSNGYVNSLYREDEQIANIIRTSKDEQILLLRNEVQRLSYQNDQLIACLIRHFSE